ncbi:catecholate siderophore receptor CirA [Kordia sp. SMS9]|uniref:TonB-dependent receptor domain-containing protein n=1 Tax=Kordia sp. SMS9 TaxID=2282170 RepID=UPI000E0D5615|nr:TonB-dependent receptor [Kordia sp. SMS9]AXG69824.1 catecholate siderophore receptor CirA [Kordia sp. SMS9]
MKKMILVLLCTSVGYMSYGQEKTPTQKDSTKTKTIKLNEVFIQGNPKRDPVLTMIKTETEKNIVQPKNIADLFSYLNGFSLIKRGNYAIDPSFRASQYEQLNIQFDGGTKAMHACPNRMDPITTHVIPEEIEKIEVIKGPYSVRYGATYAGVVNLVTQKTNLQEKGWHGAVSSGYETNGNSLVTSGKLQYITDKYDITANGGYRDFGNYEDGAGLEIPAAFRSTDYGVKVGFNPNENQRLQLHWRQSFGRDVLHAGLPMDTDEDNSSIVSLDYKIRPASKLLDEFNAKAYYSYVDHIMTNRRRPNFMMTEAISTIDARTAGGKVEMTLTPSKEVTIFTGIDAFLVARDGSRNRLVKLNMMGMELPQPMNFTDKIWQDSYVNDFGVFTEAKYALNASTIFTAGLRYDLVVSDINDPENDFAALYDLEKRNEHNIAGTVSVKKYLSDQTILEVAYGRGVRSANMIERFINHFTVGQDPFEYVGNPNLKAEVNNQFEIGLKGKAKLSENATDVNYSFSGFYSDVNNTIVAVVDPNLSRKFMPNAQPQEVKRFTNIENTYKTGFEASVGVDIVHDLTFTTDVAYVYSKNEDLNESLPLTPPLTSNFELLFEKEEYWIRANYSITSRQDHISPSFREQETPGYNVFDVRLGVKPIKNVTLGLAALNIFDAAYNNHLNFAFRNLAGFTNEPINDPGRNFSAYIKYRF